jgi:hypothetical protein
MVCWHPGVESKIPTITRQHWLLPTSFQGRFHFVKKQKLPEECMTWVCRAMNEKLVPTSKQILSKILCKLLRIFSLSTGKGNC